MKNKSKMFIVGVVLCAVGIIGLFGLFGNTDDKALLAVGSIMFAAVGVVLIILDRKKGNKPSAAQNMSIHEQAEAAKNTNDYYTFRVAGVTFSNGRKTRQAMLRKIKWGDEPFEFVSWTVEKYDFEGSPAVGVYANGEQIGNVPKENLSFVLNNWDRIRSVYHAEISGGGTDEEGKVINFGCEITLSLNK